MKADRYAPFQEEVKHDNFMSYEKYERNVETPHGFNNMFNK